MKGLGQSLLFLKIHVEFTWEGFEPCSSSDSTQTHKLSLKVGPAFELIPILRLVWEAVGQLGTLYGLSICQSLTSHRGPEQQTHNPNCRRFFFLFLNWCYIFFSYIFSFIHSEYMLSYLWVGRREIGVFLLRKHHSLVFTFLSFSFPSTPNFFLLNLGFMSLTQPSSFRTCNMAGTAHDFLISITEDISLKDLKLAAHLLCSTEN